MVILSIILTHISPFMFFCCLTTIVVQLLSHVQLFPTPWTTARQASLSLTIPQSLLKFMSIESVMLLTLSSSVTPFFSCPQSFPASGSFPVSQFFPSRGQSTGVETWYCLIWIESSHKDKSSEDKQEKRYIVFELDTELLTEGSELEARVWCIGGHHQVWGVWSFPYCPKILQNLGGPRPPSLLMPTTRLGVLKTTFRVNNSLEGLRTHWKPLYSQLWFIGLPW